VGTLPSCLDYLYKGRAGKRLIRGGVSLPSERRKAVLGRNGGSILHPDKRPKKERGEHRNSQPKEKTKISPSLGGADHAGRMGDTPACARAYCRKRHTPCPEGLGRNRSPNPGVFLLFEKKKRKLSHLLTALLTDLPCLGIKEWPMSNLSRL